MAETDQESKAITHKNGFVKMKSQDCIFKINKKNYKIKGKSKLFFVFKLLLFLDSFYVKDKMDYQNIIFHWSINGKQFESNPPAQPDPIGYDL